MCKYLSERCIRQFGYMQIIPRSPLQAAYIRNIGRDLEDILADFENHLVSVEYRTHDAISQWNYVEGYMTWFYKVLHSYMTHNAPRRPSRSVHEEFLENQQALDDHAVDVLSQSQNIMQLTRHRLGIHSRIF
ncbi:uncharacterized protein LOC131613741 [Vicia villosa]|uniref:uncharacterized protein LOC131613741 n=1 Tax=Vicia villosa TaxID=3911 RepID=UPI00273A934E|nr:uncharacterized protein LOC131613741 [Vicia villosa]